MAIKTFEKIFDIEPNKTQINTMAIPLPTSTRGCITYTFKCANGNPCFSDTGSISFDVSADGANYMSVGQHFLNSQYASGGIINPTTIPNSIGFVDFPTRFVRVIVSNDVSTEVRQLILRVHYDE